MALRLLPRLRAAVFMIALHSPGVVDLAGWPKSGVFDLGRYPSGVDALSEQIASDFDSSGLIARAEPRIMAWKYTKMLYILQNPVQAVCGPQADYADIIKQIRDEAMACFAAAGVDWVPMEDFAARQKLASPPAGSRAGGGSTWQSLARGAGSIEVDFLNGEITLLGRLHNVPTPANETIQVLADRMAREHQQPGSITPRSARETPSARGRTPHFHPPAGRGAQPSVFESAYDGSPSSGRGLGEGQVKLGATSSTFILARLTLCCAGSDRRGAGLPLICDFDHVAITPSGPRPEPYWDVFASLVRLAGRRAGAARHNLLCPYRHLVLTARLVSNIDHFSGGRFVLASASATRTEFESWERHMRTAARSRTKRYRR